MATTTPSEASRPFPADELREQRARAARLGAHALRESIRLPPALTLSEWADRYRVLSPESSAQPGPWQTDRAPYLRDIMDAISDPAVQDVTIVKCSQSGGSEVLNNAVGYYIDQEPSTILVIQPNVKPMAEAYSKDRLAPMLRDCARLRGKVRDPRARDSGNTILHKIFPGGQLTVAGANSPAGLASRPIRIVLADELDRWTRSAGTEGDPLALARKRQVTYRHRRKLVTVSSPGTDGESRIQAEWAESRQGHFYVPCPHCGAYQPLEWRDSHDHPDIRLGAGAYRLVWEKSGEGDALVHHPETARYQCRACAQLIDETAKAGMLARRKVVWMNPTARRVGFHIPGLLSPWVRWSELAAEWLLARHDQEQLKTFVNTSLGCVFSPAGEQADSGQLSARREIYCAPATAVADQWDVPAAVAVLTAGVDVQGDRLEVEVRGWAAGEESYQIRLERIYGDPESQDVWDRLEAIRTRAWRHEGGADLRIRALVVDSGYATDAVYRYVRPRQTAGVFASKGVENARAPLSRALRANRDGVKVFSFNPNTFKDTLFARLRTQHAGPGYLHFGTEAQTGADDAYFLQFGNEKRTVRWEANRPRVRYVAIRGKRNEAIDLYVLTLVGLRALGMGVYEHLATIASQVQAAGVEANATRLAPAGTAAPATPARRAGGWMRGFR
jgi:phage terminase large subunit GpA-like protein